MADHRDAPLFVAGTGSFALEVIEFALAVGYRVEALIEPIDSSRIGGSAHGLRVISPDPPPLPGAGFVVGIGAGRAEVAERLVDYGWKPVSVVHPSSVVSPSATIGDGVVVGPLAVIGAASVVGDHSLIGRGALVGHHTTLGRATVLNPGANVAGLVSAGESVTVGMGASVANGLSIGDGAVVAAGAVVVREVAAGSRVQGVPAKTFAGVSGSAE